MTSYRHTQQAPLCLLLYAVAAMQLMLVLFLPMPDVARAVVAGAGVIVLTLAAGFHHLAVVDEGDRLAIQFGPLTIFRRTLRYADIESVEVDRTTLLDGWGIHMSPRGGWVWNIAGRDCVLIRCRHSVLRVGTDDAENLSRFLESRIGDGVRA